MKKVQSRVSALARESETRPSGAPFTVTLPGNTIVGTVGRVTRTDRVSAVLETA
jgi:hypothetical protein